MRIRHLKLEVQTAKGPFSANLKFPDGLVVVWADNSMGKSTCVRAILVALGLEAMLTTSQTELPLTPAVTDELTSSNGELCGVIESDVFIEVENSERKRIVVHRTIKGTRDKNLITVVNGPAISEPNGVYTTNDYFVSRQGAATRDAGFHRYLATFLDWDLPQVQTFEGNEYPLYMQCIFPYAVVEQTRGWSSIQPPVPTQFRIRDVHKRVIEFLLDLDAYKIALRRQELGDERRRIDVEWRSTFDRAKDLADAVSGVVQNIPQRPVATWPPKIRPNLFLPRDEGWEAVQRIMSLEEEELRQLVEREIPRVQEIAETAEGELAEAESELRVRQSLLSRRLSEVEGEKNEIEMLKHRIAALDEDIQRNKDARTLQKMGSVNSPSVAQGTCPICHQAIQDSLVPLDDAQPSMSLDENIKFLSEQRRTFAGVLANAEKKQQARLKKAVTERQAIVQLHHRIRSLRQTLVSDGRLPSAAAIQNRLELENALQRHQAAAEKLDELNATFETLAGQWRSVQTELRGLPKEDTTQEDRKKLDDWSKILRSQLTQYEFQSLTIPSIGISHDTYRPEHEGFDLQTSISASDLIRTIWSYLHGLLEVAQSYKTNHPGFILFDEPRQQSARDASFEQLLSRASIGETQQVILFTSEKLERLKSALSSVKHNLIAFEGRLLKESSD